MKRRRAKAVNCAGLVATAERYMNKLFIPIAGFKGTIDDLQATEEFRPTIDEMPIDMIINM
eukprot:3377601-Ditylum_brightwellii.AAC.1